MNRFTWLVGASVLVGSVACGSAGSGNDNGTTAVVQGSVVATNPASLRVLAKTSTGKLIWTQADAKGHFALTLPKGQPYRILVAKTTTSGQNQIVGHLVLGTSKGKSLWMVPNEAIDLGRVAPANAATGGVKTLSNPSEVESDDDHDDKEGADGRNHEEDEKEDSLCKSGSSGEKDEELKSEKDPGDKCAKAGHEHEDTDHDGKADKDDDDEDDVKACGGGSAPPSGPSDPPASPPASSTQ